ncbi:TetR/AcrR family transcriptional regulator [Luteipulveratus flavus]|uniref:TetR/AcrR family transcriptional regulator n=1 Tax=Luteipulveratus flavus TaxID=3031728 RepID=A0ABT6C4E3_9MICO|nr:TetR/AcrR family transcriptional regulator [Luteipulveratus sp. YIM 133296]MDF8263693.1 TetR/AcrR family transcriptional regulator [Luteipulveratus sp. YIM 133296]
MPTARADKQRDLLDGALRVFARDGYSRASIDAIAEAAGVSTRTIYNHYGDKAGLFKAVILDSATRVADHEIALADRLLAHIVDLQTDLVAFGLAWSAHDPATADHFALVRQIQADSAHIDGEILGAWQEAGPVRVRGAVAAHLKAHAAAGLLHINDENIAALQLIQLTAGSVMAAPGARPERIIRAGVDTFLAAYQPSTSYS